MTEQIQGSQKIFKTRAELLGGHWHVTVFAANGWGMTYANIGTLVMDELDYESFVEKFDAIHKILEEP